jgi:hypothetical protein
MNLLMICPRWGCENLTAADFIRQVKDAGYDGVEIAMDGPDPLSEEAIHIAKAEGLTVITQHWDVFDRDMNVHLHKLEERLRMLMSFDPLFVNSHTGRNLFTLEENLQVFALVDRVSDDTGIPVKHETHRGRCFHTSWRTAEFLKAKPDIRLVLDMSHWCNVSESLVEDQGDFIEQVLPHVDHIHARVGWQHGPQVSDPRAPEWKEAVDAHVAWWDKLVELKKREGETQLTICPEFGPVPYLPVLPYTQQPVADQWAINRYMMEMLRERYSS